MTAAEKKELGSPAGWRVAAGDPRYIFAPGIAQPIKVGGIERAAFIVTACNAHDGLVETLKAFVDAAGKPPYASQLLTNAAALIAKAGA